MNLKRFFKRNTHNTLFKILAGAGRSMNRLYENRNHDIYSNGELTVLKKLSKHNPQVIIDGGANVGNYSRIVHTIIKNCTIYAFEPVEDTFAALAENVKSCSTIIPVRKGLFSENCKKTINLYPSSTHSSLYDIQGLSYDRVKATEIDLVKGDSFLEENHIDSVDFLKLDLEGADYDALVGFENAIRAGKIELIQFEFGYINITTKRLLIDFYNFFDSCNYVVGKIFPKTVEFRKYEFKYEDFLGPNYIAVKKSETGLIEQLRNK